jgi:DNA invertase Pin-like site-specific DNA recombinase
MVKKPKRAALYLRVSTDGQTPENQRRALEAVASQRGWTVVATYDDNGVSGAKGRDQRPGLDAMLKDATRGRFNVVMVWAMDRLGRSLADLIDTLRVLEAANVDLYLDQQAIDTTTPAGRMFFHVTGAFAEFERDMIRSRVNAGLARERTRRAAGSAKDQREGRARHQDASGGRDWHLKDGQGTRRRHERGCSGSRRRWRDRAAGGAAPNTTAVPTTRTGWCLGSRAICCRLLTLKITSPT